MPTKDRDLRRGADPIPVLEEVVVPGLEPTRPLPEELFGMGHPVTEPLPAALETLVPQLARELSVSVAEHARAALHETVQLLTEQALERAMRSLQAELETLLRERIRALVAQEAGRAADGGGV